MSGGLTWWVMKTVSAKALGRHVHSVRGASVRPVWLVRGIPRREQWDMRLEREREPRHKDHCKEARFFSVKGGESLEGIEVGSNGI